MDTHFPCLFIDLTVIYNNTRAMLDLCHQYQIEPIAVNKLSCAAEEITQTFIEAGIKTIADSRIQNLAKIAHLQVTKVMMRLPQLSEVEDVVRYADISFNSEKKTLRALSTAAVEQNKVHRVLLMQDLGDLREGCFDPEETKALARLVSELPQLELEGIGANLACYGGVPPTVVNQTMLLNVAQEIEAELNISLKTVSGASSAAIFLLQSGQLPADINQLRLGSSLIMGIGLNNDPIPTTQQNAIQLGVQLIEIKDKPSVPIGSTALDAFGRKPQFEDVGIHRRALGAIGEQDLSLAELQPFDAGIRVIGGSSDHLILDITHAETDYELGDIVYFNLSYGATLHAMTSPYVAKYWKPR